MAAGARSFDRSRVTAELRDLAQTAKLVARANRGGWDIPDDTKKSCVKDLIRLVELSFEAGNLREARQAIQTLAQLDMADTANEQFWVKAIMAMQDDGGGDDQGDEMPDALRAAVEEAARRADEVDD